MVNKMISLRGFALLLVGLLFLTGCAGAASPTPAAQATETTENIPAVRSSTSVIAEGRVVPVQDAALSLPAVGVVDEVLVKEGDLVTADQPLLRLKGNEQLEAAVSVAELELLMAQQAVKDLNDSADLSRANVQMALADAMRDLDKAENRVVGKDYTRGDQETIDTARANLILAEDAVEEAEKQYDRVDDRPEDDPIRAAGFSALAAARRKRDTAQANLNYVLARPNDLDVGEIDAKLALAQAKVANAERQLERMKDGADADQLALAEARVQNATVALNAARARLEDLELTAPFAATVSSINITAGESVTPGTPAVQLADFSTWQVETTDLTELNIDRVRVGQPAMVRFDAIPDLDVVGRVTSIKPFGENRQGDVVYTVLLSLETPDPRLRWNMTASVTFLEKDPAE
jgi:HlyD family secretion protein